MCCVVLAICCRMTKNPNRNLSQVAWDCYHRPCSDQSATAAAAASSSGADAEQSCAGQQQESCPKTSEAVSNDGIQQIIAQAVCSQTVLCRHLKLIMFVCNQVNLSVILCTAKIINQPISVQLGTMTGLTNRKN